MRVLVTGGAGMVGSHAAEHWTAAGYEVTVPANLVRRDRVRYEGLVHERPRVEGTIGEFRG